jgi:hypothetical protein
MKEFVSEFAAISPSPTKQKIDCVARTVDESGPVTSGDIYLTSAIT